MVSVLGFLTPLLWACGEADHQGGEGMAEQNYSTHGYQKGERESGRGQRIDGVPRAIPKDPLLQPDPTSDRSHHLPIIPSNYQSTDEVRALLVSHFLTSPPPNAAALEIQPSAHGPCKRQSRSKP